MKPDALRDLAGAVLNNSLAGNEQVIGGSIWREQQVGADDVDPIGPALQALDLRFAANVDHVDGVTIEVIDGGIDHHHVTIVDDGCHGRASTRDEFETTKLGQESKALPDSHSA